jgi:tRNA threonylcarbamoyladenosine biosynthesis protein TsaE
VVESYEVPFPIFFNEVSSPIDSEESSRSKRILAIFHFDFYRFSDPREWEEAGFRDHFTAPGLKVAEWAVNARAALPLADVVIRLETLDDNARQATVAAQTALGQALLA